MIGETDRELIRNRRTLSSVSFTLLDHGMKLNDTSVSSPNLPGLLLEVFFPKPSLLSSSMPSSSFVVM